MVTLNIPPLRERRGDIPYLAQALIEKHHAKMGKRLSELPRDVLRQLMEYDYPGNVRELENILIQAMFMMDGDSGFTTELLDLPAPGKAVDRRGTDFRRASPCRTISSALRRKRYAPCSTAAGGTYPSAQPVCI